MDQQHDTPQPPPAAWIEALERGRADAAAGRTVPVEPFLADLEAALTARLAKKATDAA
jgi:predicted transcriptional regulator